MPDKPGTTPSRNNISCLCHWGVVERTEPVATNQRLKIKINFIIHLYRSSELRASPSSRSKTTKLAFIYWVRRSTCLPMNEWMVFEAATGSGRLASGAADQGHGSVE
mmetsp:Transcript_19625/g.45780  ORF Transcript_19625/g.45780 Transcript_19625/m.45780 type:complete len:107 (+) Transcript_19625:1336-1656(+)